MAFTDVTNGNVDTAAAAIPGPYGPLTRTGNVANVSPNSHLPVALTSQITDPATGSARVVYLSYDQLQDPKQYNRILNDYHAGRGLNHLLYELDLISELVHEVVTDMAGPPYTDLEWQETIGILRSIQALAAQVPNTAWSEFEDNDVGGTFVLADGPSANSATITYTLTGSYTWYAIVLSDGSVYTSKNPFTSGDEHDFGTTGAVTGYILAAGPGGVIKIDGSTTIA